jgi:hypothetical protein
MRLSGQKWLEKRINTAVMHFDAALRTSQEGRSAKPQNLCFTRLCIAFTQFIRAFPGKISSRCPWNKRKNAQSTFLHYSITILFFALFGNKA